MFKKETLDNKWFLTRGEGVVSKGSFCHKVSALLQSGASR